MHPVALGAGGSSGVCFRSAACMSWDQASETEISIKPWFYNRCYFTINTTNLSLSQLVTILYFLVPRHSHFPFSKRHPFCGQNHLLTSISFKEHSLLTLHTTLEKSSTRTHTHTPVPRVGVFISHKVHMYWKPSGPFVWQPSGGSSHLTYGTRVLQCHLVGVLTLQTVHTCFSATWWEYSPYTQYRRASVPPAQLFFWSWLCAFFIFAIFSAFFCCDWIFCCPRAIPVKNKLVYTWRWRHVNETKA